jgi:hypothetical protein
MMKQRKGAACITMTKLDVALHFRKAEILHNGWVLSHRGGGEMSVVEVNPRLA